MQQNYPNTYLVNHLKIISSILFLTLLANFGFAQVPKLNDQPVLISIESYLVQERENEAGQTQEWFEKVSTAEVNQTIEVRLNVRSKAENAVPGGTLLITMPVPEGMQYIDDSATPSSELVILEFSKDNNIFADNLFHTVTIDGEEKRQAVPSEDYQALRWTVLNDFEPDEELILFYRVLKLEPEKESNN